MTENLHLIFYHFLFHFIIKKIETKITHIYIDKFLLKQSKQIRTLLFYLNNSLKNSSLNRQYRCHAIRKLYLKKIKNWKPENPRNRIKKRAI